MRLQTSNYTNDELSLLIEHILVTKGSKSFYTDDDMIIFTDEDSTLFSPPPSKKDMDDQETSKRIQVNKNRSIPTVGNREHQLEDRDESPGAATEATNSTKKRIRESDDNSCDTRMDYVDKEEKLSYDEDYFLDISFQEAIDNASI